MADARCAHRVIRFRLFCSLALALINPVAANLAQDQIEQDLDANVPATTKPVAAYRLIQESKTSKGSREASTAEFHYQLAPTKSSDGKVVTLSITMVLPEGYHSYPTTPPGEGGQPTRIELNRIQGLQPIGKKLVPDRVPEFKPTGEKLLEIYHDRVSWTQDFEVLPNARPNGYGIEGKIRYQLCNDQRCVMKSTTFVLGVTSDLVEPAAAVDFYVPPMTVKARPEDKGLLFFLLTAMAAGVVALLTPCVFPMIPITVSFFLKQSESKQGRPILMASVFALAMVCSFVLIGVGVSALFGQNKPNELANNWIINFFLAVLFFAFALNMLGTFEIRVPSWLLNMTARGEQAGGYFGVVFMALTFVLTSFSCTFAFVGSLLAATTRGEYYWPILGMLTFGATFAAPFFLLALMPRALKSLPKSGGWLNSVKVVMGFVEAGVAIKYLSVVDQQVNAIPLLFDFINVMILWTVLAICTGLYLLGVYRLSHDVPVQGLSPARVWTAIGFLMAGGLFAIGVAQPQREAWLLDQLVAIAPARFDDDHFQLDFDRGVEEAKEKNQPLFIDFTGVNCVNCRLMEKRMARHQNQQRLERFSLVQLYTDSVPLPGEFDEAKRLLARNVSLQSDWLKDVSIPAFVIATPDGKTVLASYVGTERRTGDFARFLDRGLEKWQAMQTEQ